VAAKVSVRQATSSLLILLAVTCYRTAQGPAFDQTSRVRMFSILGEL
jgi:hypothetical protein